ncbi:RsmE family RNA methyltransferase [Anaerovorax odorimutans]|uniref:RsmE family RNA methyltransferase n=1 Tax=Anaerovorax odorimutans TaxID=109327 RepID=UPI0004034375|nr:16S rRNA (uracil(1498)-N(3))-methyltransferase [Anaerovorax odorimutans]
MSRFFVLNKDVMDNTINITDKEDIKHISKVLRLNVSDCIDISDSVEFEYKTQIISMEKDCIKAKILDKQKFAREPEIKVTLFQGIPKQGKMETIIQKCVELGVSSIVPVFTDRTVVTDKGNFKNKIERWQRISDEAVKQCKRGIIPLVNNNKTFKEMLDDLDDYELIIFPYENEENYSIKDSLRNLNNIPKNIALIIGPEGGFSDKEAKELKSINAECVTLGKTILRTETAGMAALSMIMYELEL